MPLIVVGAFFLTGRLRRYALARSLMDVPNARSSHVAPTPRGGGVAIVLCFLGVQPLLVALGALNSAGAWAIGGAGALVALIGFLDDHGHIAARWRLLAHFGAAVWALVWLQPLGIVPAGVSGSLSGVLMVLAALYLVWMLNLYNFMDGIDGIASVEAICVCVGGALLYWLHGASAAALVPLSLGGAVLGFLVWNFPPAKIFMGDAGSGFLGIVLGILSFQAAAVSPSLFWSWTILLGVFVVDATYTLLRRLFRGERVYEAHRSHAYQQASRRAGRHLPVTLTVGALNLLWLLPVAVCVALGLLAGWVGVLVAYLPLVFLAVRLRAGAPERAAAP
ncbi:MraY family glycosyltransferase [Denitromonas iodatirespirans]|uniref:MraY family glycosyltransferase n=1 Tax=Denitromonas iodatirespirans TaxID=2795389 RepID=UPI001E339980|nr:glycosyltransferase family 4 protein [Denitromonas iodatirespirans]